MREYFHVPDNYFLSHSVGCLPRTAETRLQDAFLTPWKTGENWGEWMGIVDGFRRRIASLLSVSHGTICPQINVSSALTKIIHSVPKKQGRDVILISEQDFPTIGFVAAQAELAGYRLKFVAGNPVDKETWDSHMRADVAIVLVTHALSNTSHLLPVGDICATAKERGIISIVDVAQSVGAIRVKPAEWSADFAIGTGVKFLCAGPGSCFLYASPEIISQCNPVDVGWFSHENPFEMDIRNFRYSVDSMRFFGGTPSPAPLAIANAALDLWEAINLEEAYMQIQENLSFLSQYVAANQIVSPLDKASRGATFVVSPPDRAALTQALKAGHILHDERKEGFRFSVHGYMQKRELETLGKILSRASR
ncbi:MAG: aminotransferase class V-fold PLP-dependent enzyme [Maricaulaceae bacterium]